MPLPLAPLIAGGASLLGQGFNALMTKFTNRKARDFASQQSDLAWQRSVDMWNRTNEYNSPENQMARFKAAGLNPHLIYGKGTPGNATMGTPQMAKWSPSVPVISPGEAMSAYNDFRMKNAQIDNLKDIGKNLKEENTRKKLDNIIRGYKAKYAPYIESMSAQALDAMVRKRNRDIEKIMEETRRTTIDADYKKWRADFIRKHGYAPDAAPSMWKAGFDVFSWYKKLIQKEGPKLKGDPRGERGIDYTPQMIPPN